MTSGRIWHPCFGFAYVDGTLGRYTVVRLARRSRSGRIKVLAVDGLRWMSAARAARETSP